MAPQTRDNRALDVGNRITASGIFGDGFVGKLRQPGKSVELYVFENRSVADRVEDFGFFVARKI